MLKRVQNFYCSALVMTFVVAGVCFADVPKVSETLAVIEDTCPSLCSKNKGVWTGQVTHVNVCVCQSVQQRFEEASQQLAKLCENKCRIKQGEWTGDFEVTQGCRCVFDNGDTDYASLLDSESQEIAEIPYVLKGPLLSDRLERLSSTPA